MTLAIAGGTRHLFLTRWLNSGGDLISRLATGGSGDCGLEQDRADPIGAYIEGAPAGDTITVRELGGMRCGSFNYTETEAFRAAITNDPRANYTPDSPREVALL
jgi:hypothetical protein